MSGSPFAAFIDLSLAGNAGAALSAISTRLLGVHFSAQKANAALKGMNRTAGLALGGAVAIAGGALILKAVGATVQANNRYLEQVNQLKIAGADMKEMADAEAAARLTSAKVLGTTYTENLRAYRELRQAVPHLENIKDIMPTVQGMAMNLMVTKNASGIHTTREQAQEQVFDIVKAIELSQFANAKPDQINRIMNRWQESMTYFAGKVDMRDFHQVAKYSKAAFQGYSEEYLTDYMPTLIAEAKTGRGGASTVGTMGAMLYRMANGFASHKTATALEQYGLIQDKDIIRGKNGSIKGFNAGGLVGDDLMRSNPVRWMNEVVMPALERKGVNIKDNNQTLAALTGIFGSNQNAANMARLAGMQEWKFQRDRDLSRKALNINEQQRQNLGHSPAYRKEVRSAAWENIKTSLGSGLGAVLNKVMPTITMGLVRLAKFLDSPAGKVIGTGLIIIAAALGVFLVIGGIIAVVAAGFLAITTVFAGIAIGPILLIVGVIVAAVAALLFIDWGAVGHWFMNLGRGIWKGIKAFGTWVGNAIAGMAQWWTEMKAKIAITIINFFKKTWDAFWSGTTSLFNKLVNWFRELPNRLGNAVTNWAAEQGTGQVTNMGSGGNRGEPRLQQQSYVPPAPRSQQPIQVALTTNLDGRVLAQSNDTYFHRATERRPNGPSDFNSFGTNVAGATNV